MELSIWPGGWGCCSIDPKCIQAMTYVKFSGAPVKIVENNNPLSCPNWNLKNPNFRKEDGKYLHEPKAILSYLRSKNYNCDSGLENMKIAEIAAYTQLIEESLAPALYYFLFAVENNYSEVTRPFYGSRLPWTCKLWYPDWIKRKAINFVESIFGEDARYTPKLIEPYIIKKAQACINDLDAKLGNSEFFFQTKAPTSLDGLVYSYLSLFIRVPIPNCQLKEFLKNKQNLIRFVNKISQRYFPQCDGSIKFGVTYGLYGEVSKQEEESMFPLRNKIFTILFVGLSMLYYSYKQGMIKLDALPEIDHSIDIELENDEDWED